MTNYPDLVKEVNLLRDDLSEMCTIDNIDDLSSTYAKAVQKLKNIYNYNVDRIIDNPVTMDEL